MLTLWEEYEDVLNEETGEYERVKLKKRRPAGLNINGIVAMLHATNVKQAALIDSLAKRGEDLENA